MTTQDAVMITKNFEKYLKTEEVINGKKLHEDIYAALDMAIEALAEKENQ